MHRLLHGLICPEVFLVLIILCWAVIMSAYAIARHERLNSSAYDLAIESQVIWNTYNGRFFASSIEVDHYLGDHVQLIMILLAPLLSLWANTNIFLVIQAVILSLGAIPVYRMARRHLTSDRLALLFAAAYLLYPAIGFINRFDFHPLSFVILFLLLAFDLLETKHLFWASVFVFLALITREEVGLTVFMLGLYVFFFFKQRTLGIIWTVSGLLWSYIAFFAVIPHFRGGESDTLGRYAWLGNDLAMITRTLVTRPLLVFEHLFSDQLRPIFLLKLIQPLGFLSLLAPSVLMITLPALAYNLLSDTPSQSSVYFQYVSPMIPFVIVAAIFGAATARRVLAKRFTSRQSNGFLVCWVVTCILLAWWIDNPFIKKIGDPYYPVYGLERFSDKKAFLEAKALLPDNAAVATMAAYAPHLALRSELYLFSDRLRLEERPFGVPQADYYLLNLSDLRWGVNARLFYTAVEMLIGPLGYEAVYYDQEVVLLTKSAEPRSETGYVLQRVIQLFEEGGKFAPAAQPTIDWMGRQRIVSEVPPGFIHQEAQFGESIRFLGFDLHGTVEVAGRPLCVTLFWQAIEPVQGQYTVFLHMDDSDGYVHAQRDGEPGQGFWPTTKWVPGEITADLHCFQVPPNLADGKYRLLVGLYEPDTGQRLPVFNGDPDSAENAVTLEYSLAISNGTK